MTGDFIVCGCESQASALAHARNDAMRVGGSYVYVWNETGDVLEHLEWVSADGEIQEVPHER